MDATTSSASAASKFSLMHILDTGGHASVAATANAAGASAGVLRVPIAPPKQRPQQTGGGGRRRAMTAEEKRIARTCIVDGCPNYIVHRKRCFRHGGGKTCSVEGCNTSAKQRGLCWRHGGSIMCNIDGCKRGVKSRGLCWTHGGGAKRQKTSSSSGALSDLSDDDDGDDGDDSSSNATEAAAAAALAMSLRRAPARDYASSSIYSTLRRPPPPPLVVGSAPQARSGSGFVARPTSPALTALSRYCLFDDCRERPTSLNGYSSSGFCAFHAKQVTQKNYVFEL